MFERPLVSDVQAELFKAAADFYYKRTRGLSMKPMYRYERNLAPRNHEILFAKDEKDPKVPLYIMLIAGQIHALEFLSILDVTINDKNVHDLYKKIKETTDDSGNNILMSLYDKTPSDQVSYKIARVLHTLNMMGMPMEKVKDLINCRNNKGQTLDSMDKNPLITYLECVAQLDEQLKRGPFLMLGM